MFQLVWADQPTYSKFKFHHSTLDDREDRRKILNDDIRIGALFYFALRPYHGCHKFWINSDISVILSDFIGS